MERNQTGRVFKVTHDKRSRRTTAAVITVAAGIAVAIGILFPGSYTLAWYLSIVLALALLAVLTIPRCVKVGDEAVEVRCVMELREIRLRDIADVSVLGRGQTRRLVPLFASCGFFGYYGSYLDLATFDTVSVYAREWGHLVAVDDIYEKRYIISCSDPEAFAEAVLEARARALAPERGGGRTERPES